MPPEDTSLQLIQHLDCVSLGVLFLNLHLWLVLQLVFSVASDRQIPSDTS